MKPASRTQAGGRSDPAARFQHDAAPLLVVCATQREMAAALRRGDAPAAPAQGETARAPVHGRECLLLVTGVGPVSAAAHLGLALGRENPSGVLCLGVAGTFDPRVAAIGDTAVLDQAVFADYGLFGENGVDPRGIGLPQGFLNDAPVFDRLALDPDAVRERLALCVPARWPRLSGLTVCAASGTAARALDMARHGAALESMEGFALAYAAAQAGVPFIEVRTVSNLVGSRAARDWDIAGALEALARACDLLFAAGEG